MKFTFLVNTIEDIDVKHMMKKCIRIKKRQDRDLKAILTNEIKERGEVIHESTLYREMIESFISDYYSDETKQHRKPAGTLSAYIDQAMSNDETIDVAKTARIFRTTANSVAVTKNRIVKRRRSNV